MARPRTRLPWRYDDLRQEFITASGVVTLKELAELRYGIATSHIDLRGAWTGWRIRGAMLKSPRGMNVTVRPETAAQFARWLRDMEARDATAFGIESQTKRVPLYIVR